jgi:hypothetical protein
MRESARALLLGALLLAILAAGGVVLVLEPDLLRGGARTPEGVVRGFLDALNAKDWDGMMSRLSREARATAIPEDPAALMALRARIWTLVDQLGPVRFDLLDHRMEGEVAQVPATLESRAVLGQSIRRSGTFHLVREDGAWKIEARVTLEDGRVIENPLEILDQAARGHGGSSPR